MAAKSNTTEPEEEYSVPDTSADYDLSYQLIEDRGEIPDFSKDSLAGQVVRVFSISDEPETFNEDMGPVYFVKLLRVDIDAPDTPHWGVMFGANSVVVKQVQKQTRAGRMPFVARFKTTPSRTKGFSPYWSLVPVYNGS